MWRGAPARGVSQRAGRGAMRPQDLTLALLINAVWGFNFVAAKVGVGHFPPIWFSGLRFLMVALALFPFLRLPRGQLGPVLAICLFGGVLHFALMFTGVKLAGDITAIAVVTQLGIPIATILAVLLLKERIRWRRILGIALAFGGVVVMSFDPRVFGYIDAVLLITVAVTMMSLSTVLMRRLDGIGVFNLQAWIAVVSAPGLLLASLPVEEGQLAAMASAEWLLWGAVAYSAFGASVFGHGGMYYLLGRYPVSLVAPTLTLAPIFGIVWGVTMMGDVLTTKMLLGSVLTIVGVLVITLRQPELAARRLD